MKKLALITLILLAFLSTLVSCKKQDLGANTQNAKHYFYVAEVSNSNDTTKTEIVVVQ
jgi:hypothetical protein